jgi:exodeoxyribonuclease VII small subunit
VPRPPKTNSSASPAGQQSFEVSIAELAEIVEKLEAGELPLEDALALFERGMKLAKASQTILDRAERRVEQLLGFDENGKPITSDLGEEADESA